MTLTMLNNFNITKLDRKTIVCIYRFLSLIITSVFYLTGPPQASLIFKIGVVVTVIISAKIVTDLYIKHIDYPVILKTIVLVETLGIALLLIPTGGLDSPFLWYALNPVLVAGSFLSSYFSLINMFFCVTCSSVITYRLFNINNSGFLETVYEKADILLVFLLITLVVRLLSIFIKQLEIQAEVLQVQGEELKRKNDKIKSTMARLMDLYRVVETFNTMDSLDNITKSFVDYTVKLTDTDLAFCWLAPGPGKEAEVIFSQEVNCQYMINFKNKLLAEWDKLQQTTQVQKLFLDKETFYISVVRTPSKYYGILGFQELSNEVVTIEENIRHLSFLAELSSIILERLYLQKTTEDLLIAEEQNRIANEIHDKVSQRLFSISSSLYYLDLKWDELSEKILKERLHLTRVTANEALQELRSSIYRLSARKKGEKDFFTANLRAYLENMAKLNEIKVNVNIIGNEDLLSVSHKKAIYRIIYEATGNAIRHGRCKKITVNLFIDAKEARLLVKDNGVGFKYNDSVSVNRGLGITNMGNLAISAGGKLNLYSEPGKGTEVRVVFPLNKIEEIVV